MVKRIVRLMCDRCAYTADFDSVDDAKKYKWEENIIDGNLHHTVTLCPKCSQVKEMVRRAFMCNDNFGLRRNGHEPCGWHISN